MQTIRISPYTIPVDRIIYLEKKNDNTLIHMDNGEVLEVAERVESIERKLNTADEPFREDVR